MISGGRLSFVRMLNGLYKIGCDVKLFTTQGATNEFSQSPRDIINIPEGVLSRLFFIFFILPTLTFVKILRVSKEYDPDIILSNQGFFSIPSLLVARILKKKCAVVAHDAFPFLQNIRIVRKPWVFDWLRCIWYLKYFDKVLAVSPSIAATLVGLGVLKEKIFVSFQPIQLSSFAGMGQQISEYPLIINIARVVESKEPGTFVQIARETRKKDMSISFVWIGMGDLYEKYQKTASDVKFVGEVSEEEKLAWLTKSWIFVSTSKQEGFGLPIGESLLLGKPTIVFDLEAYRSVYRDNPVYVPEKNSAEIVKKILDVINQYDLYLEKAKKGQAFVKKNFSPDLISRNIRTLFESILSPQ